MTARDRMRTNLMCLDAAVTVLEAAAAMREHRVVVIKEGRVRGLVTERDIVVRCLAERRDPMWCPLEAVCPERVVLAGPETPLAEARRLMEEHGVRALPVVDGELPIGILALEDAGRDGAAPDLEDASNGAPSRHPRGLGGDAPPPS